MDEPVNKIALMVVWMVIGLLGLMTVGFWATMFAFAVTGFIVALSMIGA